MNQKLPPFTLRGRYCRLLLRLRWWRYYVTCYGWFRGVRRIILDW